VPQHQRGAAASFARVIKDTKCEAVVISSETLDDLLALARHSEKEWQPDNDAFAQEAWGRSWAEVFAVDVGRQFRPNDFEICPPGWTVRRRLRRAVREMKAMVQEILLDPALAIKAPWNDLRKRNSEFPENKSSG
jgi:hypothetical protein